jgi:hypothetical protein
MRADRAEKVCAVTLGLTRTAQMACSLVSFFSPVSAPNSRLCSSWTNSTSDRLHQPHKAPLPMPDALVSQRHRFELKRGARGREYEDQVQAQKLGLHSARLGRFAPIGP